jgi:hypothetical protein
MSGSHCGWEELVAHVFDGTPLNDPKHLEACETCSSSRRWLDALARGFELAAIPQPSPELVDAAWARIREEQREPVRGRERGAAERLREGIREVLATLTRDSLAPGFAVRSADVAAPRLLVFETADFAISVSLDRSAETVDVHGQIVPKGKRSAALAGTVRVHAGGRTLEAALSSFGEFAFETLPMQPLTLAIEIGETRIGLSVNPLGEGE